MKKISLRGGGGLHEKKSLGGGLKFWAFHPPPHVFINGIALMGFTIFVLFFQIFPPFNLYTHFFQYFFLKMRKVHFLTLSFFIF